MKVKICENKSEWNKNLESKSEFLQVYQWGEFKKKAGENILRIQVLDGEKVVNQFQGVVQNLKFIKYLYLPRISANRKEMQLLFEFLKKKGFSFVRIEYIEKKVKTKFKAKKIKNRQPENTWILNLKNSEEDLQKEMHSKTRYNIRLASKKGVEIRESKDIDIFWNLVEKTSARQKIKSHSKNYYAEMLQLSFVKQYVAYLEGVPVASNLIVEWGDMTTYLHGASDYEYRKVMSPYKLQWDVIQKAKENGFEKYDFWGTAPAEKEGSGEEKNCSNGWCWNEFHSWAGVTRFKVGFGGKPKNYPEAVDVVFSGFKYFLYKVIHKILR
ncbi:MAG: peptidoglycan bridge formation glycyltransferase FemA/FemB family protein [Candidatus Magasanikbacteria bacterium]|nr:peptidoglycan bridge formation glycyltransferase FemA/FemB family protein [Candidatus Magasanikbacteria bacterium]